MQAKEHINITRKEDCCGCKSCEQICPKHCISMKEDIEGFWYPEVDESQCILCGLCVTKCPLKQPQKETDAFEPLVYALKLKDKNELKESSSGGAFSAFANMTLEKGGVVFGCAYDEDLTPKHIQISKKEDLYKLRGSKYVATDIGSCFIQTRHLLNQNINVLFSGSGCHIAGLKAFLGKDYENLLTFEIVCHGTPSQKLFKKHIHHLSEQIGEKIQSFDFRSKSKGWGLNFKLTTHSMTVTKSADADAYYASFLRGYTYRPCCYECRFAKRNRIADITVGDFWGIEVFHPNFYNENGVSGIIINTEKGLKAWKDIQNTITCIESSMHNFSKRNHNLNAPTPKPVCRNAIYEGIDTLPYGIFVKKLKLHGKQALFSMIKNAIPKKMRISINRIRHKFF